MLLGAPCYYRSSPGSVLRHCRAFLWPTHGRSFKVHLAFLFRRKRTHGLEAMGSSGEHPGTRKRPTHGRSFKVLLAFFFRRKRTHGLEAMGSTLGPRPTHGSSFGVLFQKQKNTWLDPKKGERTTKIVPKTPRPPKTCQNPAGPLLATQRHTWAVSWDFQGSRGGPRESRRVEGSRGESRDGDPQEPRQEQESRGESRGVEGSRGESRGNPGGSRRPRPGILNFHPGPLCKPQLDSNPPKPEPRRKWFQCRFC